MLQELLSLPALPLLLLRSNSSVSTSLNLLFFHLTWSTLVISHSPLVIELVGSLLIRSIFFLLPALVFQLLEVAVPSVVAGWKSKTSSRKTGSKNGALIAIAIGNMLLATLAQGLVEYFLVYILHQKSAVKIAKTLPSPTGALWDLFVAEVVREALTYYIHRYLLHPTGKRIPTAPGKLHQRWAHTGYGAGTGSFAAHYDHPVPYLLLHFIPTYLPGTLFSRMHVLTFFLHLMIISVTEAVTFSGYTYAPMGFIPFGFMLGWMTKRVDGHFTSGGKKAFGIWGVMDWVHGTRVEAGGEEYMRGKVERGMDRFGEFTEGRNESPRRGRSRRGNGS